MVKARSVPGLSRLEARETPRRKRALRQSTARSIRCVKGGAARLFDVGEQLLYALIRHIRAGALELGSETFLRGGPNDIAIGVDEPHGRHGFMLTFNDL